MKKPQKIKGIIMSLYRVVIKEVHHQFIWVEADDIDDAVKKVAEDEGEDLHS